jgi:DnaK suppressor protein
MKSDAKHAPVTRTPVDARYEQLKEMLVARRRDLLDEVHGKIRSAREEGSQHHHGILGGDNASDPDVHDDLDFALIQMKAETLNKINEALIRLDEGNYGRCFECGDAIAPPRLRALPFAVRCKDCEEGIEISQQRARVQARRAAAALAFELRG